MSDTTTTTEPDKVTEESTETTTEVTTNGETGEQTTQTEETTTETTLSPEDAVKEVSKVRAEAASWRTKYRDLEKKFAEAKTPEEVDTLVKSMAAEREAAERTLVVENVALKHRLPEDLTRVLVDGAEGKTREQLEAHAAVLAKYLPSQEEDPDLQGGLRPGTSDQSFDPVAEVNRHRRSRR